MSIMETLRKQYLGIAATAMLAPAIVTAAAPKDESDLEVALKDSVGVELVDRSYAAGDVMAAIPPSNNYEVRELGENFREVIASTPGNVIVRYDFQHPKITSQMREKDEVRWQKSLEMYGDIATFYEVDATNFERSTKLKVLTELEKPSFPSVVVYVDNNIVRRSRGPPPSLSTANNAAEAIKQYLK